MARCRTIIWSLTAGVVASVAVAWGCALWSDVEADEPVSLADGPLPAHALAAPPEWLVLLSPEDWIAGGYKECRGFGLRYQQLSVTEVEGGPIDGWAAAHTLLEWRAGWPMKALKCGACFEDISLNFPGVRNGLMPPEWMHPKFRDEFPAPEGYLPMMPIGWGLAADSVCYGAVVFMVCVGFAAVRRRLRRRAGRCPHCGYDLRGHTGDGAGTCPECGVGARTVVLPGG